MSASIAIDADADHINVARKDPGNTVVVKSFPIDASHEEVLEYIESHCRGDKDAARVQLLSTCDPVLQSQIEGKFKTRCSPLNPMDAVVKGLHFLLDPANQLAEHNHVTQTPANHKKPDTDDVTTASTNQAPENSHVPVGPTNEYIEKQYMSEEELDVIIASKEKFMKTSVAYLRQGSDWEFSDAALAEHKQYVLDARKEKIKEPVYPVLLVILEESTTFIKVHSPEEGSGYEVLDVAMSGEGSLMGMGSLITGAKNLPEFLDLAEKGDYRSVHATIDMNRGGGESAKKQDPYNNLFKPHRYKEHPSIIFCFGQTEGKTLGEYTKEDMATSLLWKEMTAITETLSHLMLPGGAASGVGHVIAVGSLLQRPRVANMFLGLWHKHVFGAAMFGAQNITSSLHLLQHGAYLKTIGSVLQ